MTSSGLSSKAILDAIKGLHTGGNQGRAEALRRQVTNGMNASTATRAQDHFIADLAHIPRPAAREVYAHPGDAVAAAPQLPAGDGRTERTAAPVSLSAADVEWLRRLPTDPAQVPWDDAKQLLALQQSVTNPSDRRLLDSIARPVRMWHDENAALVAQRNAQLPMTPIPATALPALADAIQNEVPQLTPDEAVGRAADQIAAVAAQRDLEREQKLREAESALADLAQQKSERAVVVKGAPGSPTQTGASDPADRDQWYTGPRA